MPAHCVADDNLHSCVGLVIMIQHLIIYVVKAQSRLLYCTQDITVAILLLMHQVQARPFLAAADLAQVQARSPCSFASNLAQVQARSSCSFVKSSSGPG
jgi:hypothetical protein